jgi:hypothetical protein
MILYEETHKAAYLDAARGLNRYVRRTTPADAPDTARGAVKGSFPVDGDYCTFEYPNWATKFAIDSYTLEQRLTG